MNNLKQECKEYIVFRYETNGRSFVGAYPVYQNMDKYFDEDNSFCVSSISMREARKEGLMYFLPNVNVKKYPISLSWEAI